MLSIEVNDMEIYDAETSEFTTIRGIGLKLEHSLVSLSSWESKWQIPFLKPNLVMTPPQTLSYIECMTITQNVPSVIFDHLFNEKLSVIYDYIQNPMTATTISNINGKKSREIITSEIIYYWMTAFNIPYHYQKWHLNRLLTLISVCNLKQAPPKKMSRSDLNRTNSALNQSRLNSLNTRG